MVHLVQSRVRVDEGVQLNSETRTRERRKLMITMLEKKVRMRARQLYDERGQVEGLALDDWAQAESEVLKTSILAPLWGVRHEMQLADSPTDDLQSNDLPSTTPPPSDSQSLDA